MGSKSAWTEERRARQAEIVRETKPWLKSTGPKTAEGKLASSQNALMSNVIREARQNSREIMTGALYIFGRKRWPKGMGERRQSR